MRKSAIFALIAMATATVACNKENFEEQPVLGDSNKIVFTAELPTRTATANDQTVTWVAGDEVKFVWAGGSATATASASGASTTFSVEVADGITELYAVYPASAGGSYDEGNVNVHFNGSRTDGSFAANDICVAKAVKNGDTWSTTLEFKNAACLLKVGVSSSSVDKIQVFAGNGEAIAGYLPINIDGSGAPSLGEVLVSPSDHVTMTVSGPGDYYIPMLPGVTLSKGFQVKLFEGENQLTPFYYNGSFTTTRGQIVKLDNLEAHAGQYYVTPSGAGSKAGQSWSQAMDIDKFKAFVTNQDNHFILKGSTFHFSAEEFSFGDDYLVLHYPDHSKVAFTLEGTVTASDTTVFVGRTNTSDSNKAGVLWPQANSNITVKNVKFTGTNGKGNSAAIRLNNGAETFTLDHCYFRDNETDGNGAAIAVYNSCALTVKNCSFSNNSGIGGALFLNSGSATAVIEDSEIKNNTYGAIRADAASTIEITRTNFTGNDGVNYSGPAVRFGGSPTVTITDCDFVGNHCNSGAGTIAVSSSTVDLNVIGGKFEGNHADGTTNDDSAGAVIYDWGGSTVTFTDVLFKENYNNVGTNTQSGGIIRLGKNTCVARFNGCTFDGNYSYRSYSDNPSNASLAAIIQNRQGGAKYYFNACEFKHNSSGLDSERIGGFYGMLVAAYSTCTIGMNNCSIHDNYGQRNPEEPQTTWFHLSNTSNTFILSNSTIIGDAQRTPQMGGAVHKDHWSVLKLNTTGNYYLLNDIICSKFSDGCGIWCGAGNTSINAYYTKMSPEGDGRAVWTNNTGAGFNYYSAYLGSYDGTHVWNGTFSAGTNKDSFAATSDVNAQIEAADAGFYAWLNSIGALGKDINGNNRGATSWPGCYQN
ncbi:MAG: right-handed parallel beta-helix repeat-containing protein [Bacteroidales bacterium]|nr:right-handed parallel beta-helix repeat-containing protein [Bacteroidales bacterium]